ncbi:hypothetical protein D3C84_1089310 [compost metagenome]
MATLVPWLQLIFRLKSAAARRPPLGAESVPMSLMETVPMGTETDLSLPLASSTEQASLLIMPVKLIWP